MIIRNVSKPPLLTRANPAGQGSRGCSRSSGTYRASNRVAGSTSSAPGDPAGERAPPAPGSTRRRPSTNVTTPGPIPPSTTQHDRLAGGASWHSEFRQPCAVNGRRASPGKCASCRPAAATSGTGRSRAPDAACGPAGIFSAVSPALLDAAIRRQDASRCQPVARARRRRPGAGAGKPCRERARTRRPFRTASYSVLLYVYLPTPEPPGPGECAGSARNKPSRELPDLYTRTARKTIVIGAPGK